MSVDVLSGFAIDALQQQQGHAFTAQELVQLLWTNATGSVGTQQQLQPFVQQLQSGELASRELVDAAVQYALAHPSVELVALLVLGPERLPGAARTAGLWIGRLKRSFNAIKQEVEREIGADEIRRQLHNEHILSMEEEAKKILAPLQDAVKPPTPPQTPEAPAPVETASHAPISLNKTPCDNVIKSIYFKLLGLPVRNRRLLRLAAFSTELQ